VPGTWVQPAQPGLLWTPPYWSRVDGGYAFHAGYWAAEVGFYGGINYGYGCAGDGYQGRPLGEWRVLLQSRREQSGSLGIANVYDRSVTDDDNAVRVSFNGGRRARPRGRHGTRRRWQRGAYWC